MAEEKYRLLLEPRRDSNIKIRHQPWYEERLKRKYEKKPTLIASSWTFIKDGLDDFRDGRPPSIDSSIIIKGNKGFKPNIHGTCSFDGSEPKQSLPRRISKEDAVYSKTVPQHRKRKERITTVENHLLDHPLALYSHLEESVPPDLFEDIVDLLDPSLTLKEKDIIEDDDAEFSFTPPLVNIHVKSDISLKKETCSGYGKAIINSQKKSKAFSDEEVVKEEKNRVNKKKVAQPQLTKIETVTKDFCDWVSDLGGESNNIEESTISTLFASGYETKPTLSVPVHVVELTNVPPELRADDISTENDANILTDNKNENYTPSWVKVKFGAWYLNPKTWKSRKFNEPLKDPKEVDGKKMPEAKERSKELDKILSTLHGAKAFRSFVDKKGTRKPKFLEGVPITLDDGTVVCSDETKNVQ